MKKFISLVSLLLLVLTLVSCASITEKVAEKIEETIDETIEESGIMEDISKAKEDEEKPEDSDSEKEEVVIKLDSGKNGIELLKSVQFNPPKSVISTTESFTADGTVTKGKSYVKGDFMRNETGSAESGIQIDIYNPETGATYTYGKGEETGYVSYEDEYEDEDEDDDMEMSLTGGTFADIFVEDESTIIEATVEDLDGIQVIHIHTTEADGEDSTMDMHVWYAVEYTLAMKYEVYMNGMLMGGLKIVDYEINVDIDNSLFEEPEDVSFIEW